MISKISWKTNLSHTISIISFGASVISQFMHSPYERHFEAAYQVLRYLKGAPGKGLFFRGGEQMNVKVCIDVDWVGSVNDMKSTSGYCTFVGGNLEKLKQWAVARSSAKAEFQVVAQDIDKLVWLMMLLEELKINIAQNPI